MFGAMTTYWDKAFGEKEANYWLHGFMIGVAYTPYAIYMASPLSLVARCFFLAIFMGTWCKVFSNDWFEEMGRGFIIPISILLMLI